MPEAAEAQLKIANIHYKEMEKADRDYTHAKRAEEEYRQLIMQYPDSKLVPEAKQKLLQVQEVLAQREYMIGHFYYQRESWPAAIARLKSVADTYPLYSGSDQALYELGGAYEREIALLRMSKLPEAAKGTMIKKYTDDAAAAYDRILTRYPMEERAPDAKKRLEALKRPIPTATPEAIAQNKAEIAGRGSLGMTGKIMENFKHGPDISESTTVGEPTLVDPKQTSAPEMVRSFSSDVRGAMGMSTKDSTVERLTGGKGAPAANEPVPRSDAAPGASDVAAAGGDATAVQPTAAPPASAGGPLNGSAASGLNNNDATSDLKNDLTPAASTPPPGSAAKPAATTSQTAAAPPLPPTQVNDAAPTDPPSSSSTAQPAASSTDGTQTPPAADPNAESSSKKKKKHHFPF
jgi:outer membrane protein assembly factor BamD